MLVPRVHSPILQQTLLNLRKAITEGEFKPGERLIERELCRTTGVSRTSVREALRLLEAEGLVNVIPQKGPIVAVVKFEDVKDLYQVRQVLEGLACRLFAERATSPEITALAKATRLYEKACNKGSTKELIRVKNDFYEVILKGCRNRIVHSLIMSLHARITFLRSISLSQPGRSLQSLSEIKSIVEAIEHHDPDATWAACINHIRNAEVVALEVVRRTEEENSSKRTCEKFEWVPKV